MSDAAAAAPAAAADGAGAGAGAGGAADASSAKKARRNVGSKTEGRLWQIMTGALLTTQIQAGVNVGLFEALAKQDGPVTGDELAAAAGSDPRFTTEWCRAMASAKVITYAGDDKFEMDDEQKVCLASPGVFGNLIGAFLSTEAICCDNKAFVERALRTGVGASYDEQGTKLAVSIEQMHKPWMETKLVPFLKLHVPTVVEKLAAGGTAADIGCGAAGGLVAMALEWPASTFHGFESSKVALEQAARNIAEAGVGDRVIMHDFGAGERLPTDGSLDFVFSHDVLHDVVDPVSVISSALKAVNADTGIYMAGEPPALPTHDLNIRKNPGAALMYSFSTTVCMQSASSEPGGPQLGTCGFSEAVGLDLFSRGGFPRTKVVMDNKEQAGNRFFIGYARAEGESAL